MTLQYKDYVGEVYFDNALLVVKILHIEDMITATFEKASDAQAVFEELVDDYLDTCAVVGKEASKPFKGSFNVRVDPAIHRQAALAASSIGITLNAWVKDAVVEKLDGKSHVQSAENAIRRFMEQRSHVEQASEAHLWRFAAVPASTIEVNEGSVSEDWGVKPQAGPSRVRAPAWTTNPTH